MRRTKTEHKRRAVFKCLCLFGVTEKRFEHICALLYRHNGVFVQLVNAQKSVARADKRRCAKIDRALFGLDSTNEEIVEAFVFFILEQAHIYRIAANEFFNYRF